MNGFDIFFQVLLHPHFSYFFNPFTVIGYAIVMLILFLPCWLLTRNMKRIFRILIRMTFGAIIFAPGFLTDPDGASLAFVPGLLASLYYLRLGATWLFVNLVLIPAAITGFLIWIISGMANLLVFFLSKRSTYLRR